MSKKFPFAGHMSWFPGHMAKATRLIESKIKAADVVIEVRDARVRSKCTFSLTGVVGRVRLCVPLSFRFHFRHKTLH